MPAPSSSFDKTLAGAFTRFDQNNNQRNHGLFWRLQFIGWGATIFVSLIFLIELVGLQKAIVISVVRAISGLAISCGLRELFHRIPWRQMQPWTVFFLVGPLCLALGFIESTGSEHFIFSHIGTPPPDELRPMLMRFGIVGRFFSFFGWSLLYFAVKIRSESIAAKLHASRLEAAARTAELRQLQAQVNPHFLFNALNSILAEKNDGDAVERITQELADYLRYALSSQGGFAPLGIELDQLERYLRLEKSRFEDRFIYTIDADPAARAVPTPAALVLPLLENACKYGRKTGPRILRVRLHARRIGPELRITVSNTGHWLAFDPAQSHGTGLANLRRRLELLSHHCARVEQSAADGWVSVSLTWPIDCSPASDPDTSHP